MNDFYFDDDQVEGKVHEIEGDNEEDMSVYGCYLLECLTFNKRVDISAKGTQYLRNRIVDAILAFTYL